MSTCNKIFVITWMIIIWFTWMFITISSYWLIQYNDHMWSSSSHWQELPLSYKCSMITVSSVISTIFKVIIWVLSGLLTFISTFAWSPPFPSQISTISIWANSLTYGWLGIWEDDLHLKILIKELIAKNIIKPTVSKKKNYWISS